jgi:hypothetical protein
MAADRLDLIRIGDSQWNLVRSRIGNGPSVDMNGVIWLQKANIFTYMLQDGSEIEATCSFD